MLVFFSYHLSKPSLDQAINSLPIYPTEDILWNKNILPNLKHDSSSCLSLPKLNLQFLTIYDYLLRNFNLFRLEATYEIREDLAKTIWRIRPKLRNNQDGSIQTIFSGYSRMAVPIDNFIITSIKKPKLGEIKPSKVKAEIMLDLSPFKNLTLYEWNHLRKNDILFLIQVKGTKYWEEIDSRKKKLGTRSKIWTNLTSEELGVYRVRGTEISQVKDETGKILKEHIQDWKNFKIIGTKRTFVVELDPTQYQIDMTQMTKEGVEDPYSNFNLLIRRSGKENNFKSILTTIRELMNDENIGLPNWFMNSFLGYGDPNWTQYWRIKNQNKTLNFNDTFLDFQHVIDSFPNRRIIVKEICFGKNVPPYKVIFFGQKEKPEYNELMQTVFIKHKKFEFNSIWDYKQMHKLMKSNGFKPSEFKSLKKLDDKLNTMFKDKKYGIENIAKDFKNFKCFLTFLRKLIESSNPVIIESIPHLCRGPYEWQRILKKKNFIRFTPIQVEAIRSGMLFGLTIICGPPGTGKTDIAVQIVSNLYKTNPYERSLLITHSNYALNDIFEKISLRDIDERYLLRLGYGVKKLQTNGDFSKFGRTVYLGERRKKLLEQAKGLALTLKLDKERAELCETCEHFFRQFILSNWEKFLEKVSNKKTDTKIIAKNFPFKIFFSDVRKPLFLEKTWKDDMDFAELCWTHLKNLFKEIQECRILELLKYGNDQGDYLISRHAKIIAMTCTHAAMKRSEFLRLRMQYENVIFEETSQILDIETFIPLLLQKTDSEDNYRLKRIVLIGDHNQLPPIVKNIAFQKYCRMDQSLYERFVRLGIPIVNLTLQGRSRSSIAKLYSWKYKYLGNLPNVLMESQYLHANAGLLYDYQFINVPDYKKNGESTPFPFFYQNLGEAEYCVHLYMYMRLIGIPSEKVSIITTYNGQKHLIRNIIQYRCENNPLYGCPSRITTVDKYQGQQNDYVILSLVRTKNVGHIRDIRRLVVALSRARLGLYVFGRFNIFKNCIEMGPTFNLFSKRSQKLMLVPGEETMTCKRKTKDPVIDAFEILNVEHLAVLLAELSIWRRGQSLFYRMTKHEIEKIEKVKIDEFLEENKKRIRNKEKKLLFKINNSRKILHSKLKKNGYIFFKKKSIQSKMNLLDNNKSEFLSEKEMNQV